MVHQPEINQCIENSQQHQKRIERVVVVPVADSGVLSDELYLLLESKRASVVQQHGSRWVAEENVMEHHKMQATATVAARGIT